jgi:hypothetical protein
MRTLLSSLAGFALVAGVASHSAVAADIHQSQPQRTIFVTAGQGGTITIVLPPAVETPTNPGPAQTIAVTAGQAGSIAVIVPTPDADAVAAKAPVKGGTQMTVLPTE